MHVTDIFTSCRRVNACLAVSLKTVVTGGQFKKLNTLLFLSKFLFKIELGIIYSPTCRKI